MYEAHFGLSENPFGVNPDPRFLYLSEVHREALAHLIYGVRQRKGFIVITGDVGTGKTTLLQKLIQGLDERTRWVFITNPRLSTEDFLRAIAHGLRLVVADSGKGSFLIAMEAMLSGCLRRGENVVLVVDEAQNLSGDLLEEVRLLSNLETASEKMLQIILVGQQELNDKLLQEGLRQLRQRVSIKYHLQPLGPEETSHYVQHRLWVAGGGGREIFSDGALSALHAASGGFPRLINNLCDNAMLAAYSRNLTRVDAPLIEETVREMAASYPGRTPAAPPPAAAAPEAAQGLPAPEPKSRVGRGWLWGWTAALLLGLLGAGLALAHGLWGACWPLTGLVP